MPGRIARNKDAADVSDPIAPFATRYGLSERERQVLVSASLGRASKETADVLKCSRHTVDEYWARIFRKTDCHSQVAVLAKILRQQIRAGAEVGEVGEVREVSDACGDHRDMTAGRTSR
jgi:DNA-binding CsgD family transcriptional regulator